MRNAPLTGSRSPDADDGAPTDRGDTMLITCILVAFLLLASFTLVSASQRWAALRDAQAAASAAARAAAQVSEAEVRGGVRIDPALAQQRASRILQASGYGGQAVVAGDGLSVTVSASRSLTYTFPAPGLGGDVSASGRAVATKGVGAAVGGNP